MVAYQELYCVKGCVTQCQSFSHVFGELRNFCLTQTLSGGKNITPPKSIGSMHWLKALIRRLVLIS